MCYSSCELNFSSLYVLLPLHGFIEVSVSLCAYFPFGLYQKLFVSRSSEVFMIKSSAESLPFLFICLLSIFLQTVIHFASFKIVGWIRFLLRSNAIFSGKYFASTTPPLKQKKSLKITTYWTFRKWLCTSIREVRIANMRSNSLCNIRPTHYLTKGDISYIFTNLVSMAMIIKARNYIENDTDSYKGSDDDRRSR